MTLRICSGIGPSCPAWNTLTLISPLGETRHRRGERIRAHARMGFCASTWPIRSVTCCAATPPVSETTIAAAIAVILPSFIMMLSLVFPPKRPSPRIQC